jgi:hypothetical protein
LLFELLEALPGLEFFALQHFQPLRQIYTDIDGYRPVQTDIDDRYRRI